MSKPQFIPITPSVLRWAVRESGYDGQSLASEIGVTEEELQSWQDGSAQPTKTKFDALVAKLKRPTALFFLPQPPDSLLPHVQFRRPHGSTRRSPSPKELRHLREAQRLCTTTSWIFREMRVARATVPHISASTEVEAAAAKVRALLLGDTSQHHKPTTPAKEQGQWRARLEAQGVFVLMLPLGRESIRGFSLYDDFAPIVAVNTHWDYRPRVFTMLHEFNHLVSRTSSACVETLQQRLPDTEDRVERWCEQVAAAVLMPWPEVSSFLSRDLQLSSERQVTSLDQLFRIAKYFGTSARAAALRLIGRKRAAWELYRQIPTTAEQKPGGGGGGGRNRQEIREDEYGGRMIRTFSQAVEEGLMTATDATGFLRISESELESWHG